MMFRMQLSGPHKELLPTVLGPRSDWMKFIGQQLHGLVLDAVIAEREACAHEADVLGGVEVADRIRRRRVPKNINIESHHGHKNERSKHP